MKLLVTGGLGFIGSHVARLAVEHDHEVLIIDDLSGGFQRNCPPGAKAEICDCREADKLEKIFASFKPEIVYHLAANAAENKSQFSPIDITSRNFDAFIKVLTSGIRNGMRKIVVTSSIAVYGDLPKKPYKESYEPQPVDLYGLSKLSMERALKIMSDVHGFEYMITRPHNVYGPGQSMADPYRNVVTIFMNALLKNQPYYIYGDGSMTRCFSYIDPVAKAIFDCGFVNSKKRIFNVGSDTPYTIQQLSDTIQKVAGVNMPPIYLPARPHEVKEAISDHKLAKKYLGFVDNISLFEGLKNTWNYAQKLGPQLVQLQDLEINSDKVPTNWKKV